MDNLIDRDALIDSIAEQLSLFEIEQPDELIAVCCMGNSETEARKPDAWMKNIVPDGEYVISVGIHPMVLRPTKMSVADVPEGHGYYHYQIGGRVYSGVFVGTLGADKQTAEIDFDYETED